MPYRLDIDSPPPHALDVLIELGALDLEPAGSGLAAILPDTVSPKVLSSRLGRCKIRTSDAVARDNGSVWLLSPQPIRVGAFLLAPPQTADIHGLVRLKDSPVFGTGHHVTTLLCLEILEEILSIEHMDSILDVGTGSGILALAGLIFGVKQAVGVDIDPEAIAVAAENARWNHVEARLQLMVGDPGVLDGRWPLVIANVLAAPLMEMASVLVRRVGTRGRLILSGIACSLQGEVRQVYQNLGMRHVESKTRDGWALIVFQASW